MSTIPTPYPFDPVGTAASNKVTETQIIQPRGTFDHYYIVPRYAPFYAESVKLRLYPMGANVNNPAGGRLLVEGVDYDLGYHFAHASHTIGKAVYGSINFFMKQPAIEGQLRMEYQTVGDVWTLSTEDYMELLANVIFNPRITTWEHVVELPFQFPVVNHTFDIKDFTGMSDVEQKLDDIEAAILQANAGGLLDHINNKANPHEVTKDQVGLGLVDNFPSATVGEAQAGTSNNRFMTPLRTKNLIDAIVVPVINAHVNDTGNPHSVTKAQVGLGNVQNYAVASQSEAEAGASNARYMTPLRVREFCEFNFIGPLNAHINNNGNPHGVTKAQVGLGLVPNIGIATPEQTLQGNNDLGMITPRLLSYYIAETVGDGLAQHIADFTNPHEVTKAQVGLGLVPNYAPASEAAARDATANNLFMTPLAVRWAINELVGEFSTEHAGDKNNPHEVTAAQVGAYSIAQVDTLLAGKLGINSDAYNSVRVFGMGQSAFTTWLASQTAGNAIRIDGRTYSEAKSDILAGQASDSQRLGGKTLAEVLAEASAGGGGSVGEERFVVPFTISLTDEGVPLDPVPEHWVEVGKVTQAAGSFSNDLALLITGGRRLDIAGSVSGAALLSMTIRYVPIASGSSVMHLTVDGSRLRLITPGGENIQVGYISSGTDDHAEVSIWLRRSGPTDTVVIKELSNGVYTHTAPLVIITTEEAPIVPPSGISYAPVVGDGEADIQALKAFSQRTDNPHGVTKAQVGLGSVANYPMASNPEAVAGTATNRYMAPAGTAALVDDRIATLCTELGAIIDAATASL